jgi:hypothetical protein
MIGVVPLEATVLVAMVTVTEAHLAVDIMMMIAVTDVHHQDLVVLLMTTHLLHAVVVSMILIVETTHLLTPTSTAMVDHLTIVLLATTPQEMPDMLMMVTVVAAIGKSSFQIGSRSDLLDSAHIT